MLNAAHLPESTFIARVSIESPIDESLEFLSLAFSDILSENDQPHLRYYTDFAPVSGLSGSCRVCMPGEFPESVPLSRPMTPLELATEFLTKLYLEARFPPYPFNEGRRSSRCYEVRLITMDEHIGALVTAGWMTAE